MRVLRANGFLRHFYNVARPMATHSNERVWREGKKILEFLRLANLLNNVHIFCTQAAEISAASYEETDQLILTLFFARQARLSLRQTLYVCR